MHTGNHNDAVAFYLEEEAVREAPYASPSYFRMYHLEGEGTSRDDLYSGIHRQSKAHAKVRRMPSYQASASFRSASASRIQTTGSVTAS
jgi:hypothetical protein